MRRSLFFLLFLAIVATGCFRSFNVRQYSTSTSLYQAGMEKYRNAGLHAQDRIQRERLAERKRRRTRCATVSRR